MFFPKIESVILAVSRHGILLIFTPKMARNGNLKKKKSSDSTVHYVQRVACRSTGIRKSTDRHKRILSITHYSNIVQTETQIQQKCPICCQSTKYSYSILLSNVKCLSISPKKIEIDAFVMCFAIPTIIIFFTHDVRMVPALDEMCEVIIVGVLESAADKITGIIRYAFCFGDLQWFTEHITDLFMIFRTNKKCTLQNVLLTLCHQWC